MTVMIEGAILRLEIILKAASKYFKRNKPKRRGMPTYDNPPAPPPPRSGCYQPTSPLKNALPPQPNKGRNEVYIMIKKCSDPMMWYSNQIGIVIQLIRELDDSYLCRENAGFLNIVLKEDASKILIHSVNL